MASIQQKGKKLYIVYSDNGKQKWKSSGLDVTKANRKFLEKEVLPTYAQQEMGIRRAKKKSIPEYADEFLRHGEWKASTRRRYEGIVRIIDRDFRYLFPDEVRASDLREWLKAMDRSPKTVRNVVTVFKQILDLALEDEVIDLNPFVRVRLPKLREVEILPFTMKEAEMILDNTEGWFKHYLAIAFYTGMRTGEIIGLKWEDIDWNEQTILVRRSRIRGEIDTTKTGKSRIVPLFDALLPYLKERYRDNGLRHGFLFEDASDASAVARHKWKPLLKRLGIPYRRLYNTRHSFATEMLKSGLLSPFEIAKLLGHSSTQMLFQTYAKFIRTEQVKIDKKIDLIRNGLEEGSGKVEIYGATGEI